MAIIYDLVIIGAGPAGLTAAIYAGRCFALKALVVGELAGGQVAEAGMVDNYPGLFEVEGLELSKKMVEHAEKVGIEVRSGKVTEIEKVGKIFRLLTDEEALEARCIILATGAGPRKLGVPGEAELVGRGVSYCALCDAPLYKGKTVAMVGGGDSALDGALELAEHVSKIYLIHRGTEFRAKPDFVQRAKDSPKIEFVMETNVTQISGESSVDSLSLDRKFEGQGELKVDGVFIEIGNVPDRKLAENLGLGTNDYGYVKVAEDMSTNVAGAYAAGDITLGSNNMKQIVTACAEGAIATQSVYRFLGDRKTGSLGSADFPGLSSPADPKKTLEIDKDLCIGCGLCATIAANTFELGGDGKASVKDLAGDSESDIQDAIDSCPVSAISWG